MQAPAAPGLVVEYVSAEPNISLLDPELAAVFGKFASAEELVGAPQIASVATACQSVGSALEHSLRLPLDLPGTR